MRSDGGARWLRRCNPPSMRDAGDSQATGVGGDGCAGLGEAGHGISQSPSQLASLTESGRLPSR